VQKTRQNTANDEKHRKHGFHDFLLSLPMI